GCRHHQGQCHRNDLFHGSVLLETQGAKNVPSALAECTQGTFAAKSNKNGPPAVLPSLGVHKGRRRSGALPSACFLRFCCFAVLPPGAAKPKLSCVSSAFII